MRIVVPAGLLDEFDFSTLARVPSEYVSEELLADIGDWLVRCDTGEEFLARAGAEAADVRDRSDG